MISDCTIYCTISDIRTRNAATGLGIRSFTHPSFAHFAQFKWATVSDLLRSLKTNERPWANRSGRSWKMSDRERFAQVAQVAHDKWAMWANRSGCSPKMSNHEQFAQVAHEKWVNEQFAQKTLTKIVFFGAFFVCKKNTSNLLIPSFLMSDAAQVAHQKWAMWANRSGCSLCKNERPWVICSGRSSKMSDHEQIPQVAHQKWANEQIVGFFWAIRSENQWANSQPWEN